MTVVSGVALANAAVVVGIDAAISYLGFSPALPNWGSMINEARSEGLGYMLMPALWVALTAAAFNRLSTLIAERHYGAELLAPTGTEPLSEG